MDVHAMGSSGSCQSLNASHHSRPTRRSPRGQKLSNGAQPNDTEGGDSTIMRELTEQEDKGWKVTSSNPSACIRFLLTSILRVWHCDLQSPAVQVRVVPVTKINCPVVGKKTA